MSSLLNVLVVGAGQIGSRHLQGLAASDKVKSVAVVDPSSFSLERALERWMSIPNHKNIAFQSFQHACELPLTDYDFAIIATNATNRLQHLQFVCDLGIKNILSEKLLFQSLNELEQANKLCEKRGINLYTNYVYRYASPWQHLASVLGGCVFKMVINAGDIGLATNLPHWLDLFGFLSQGELSNLNISILGQTYPSKRGQGLLDFSGIVNSEASSGSTLEMTFAETKQSPIVRIECSKGYITLDENSGMIEGSLLSSEYKLQVPMVSSITTNILDDFVSGTMRYPLLHSTFTMNHLLLSALGMGLFGKSDKNIIIPIT
tara:strand:+ start:973 stop:1929 length:957 start_codon:yes stop_codon:yes gene_type:complete